MIFQTPSSPTECQCCMNARKIMGTILGETFNMYSDCVKQTGKFNEDEMVVYKLMHRGRCRDLYGMHLNYSSLHHNELANE